MSQATSHATLGLAPQPRMSDNGEHYSQKCLQRYRTVIGGGRHRLNASYGSDPAHTLDIFLPDEAFRQDLPILVFFHGGGWTNGYKEWSGIMAPTATRLPAILVCPSYRLIPRVSYPTPLDDCMLAVKWVREHATEYGGSPEKIFIGGHSAGGQIAALLTLEHQMLARHGLSALDFKGCHCVSASLHRRMINAGIAPDHVPAGDPEAIQFDSPLALADKAQGTSFLITWGGEESRLVENSRKMAQLLAQAGCPVTSHVYPGKGHFDMHTDLAEPNSPASRDLAHWMAQVLEAQP